MSFRVDGDFISGLNDDIVLDKEKSRDLTIILRLYQCKNIGKVPPQLM